MVRKRCDIAYRRGTGVDWFVHICFELFLFIYMASVATLLRQLVISSILACVMSLNLFPKLAFAHRLTSWWF